MFCKEFQVLPYYYISSMVLPILFFVMSRSSSWYELWIDDWAIVIYLYLKFKAQNFWLGTSAIPNDVLSVDFVLKQPSHVLGFFTVVIEQQFSYQILKAC